MSWQAKVCALGSRRGIDRRNGASAVSDQDALRVRIDADVVSIISQLDTTCFSIISAAIQTNRSVTPIGNVQRIARWLIAHALRFVQSRDDMNDLARREVDNPERVVFK